MRVIGLPKKNLQQCFILLKNKIEVAFLEEKKNTEVVICPGLDYYKENILNFQKNRNTCKVFLILDYWRNLKKFSNIEILEDLTVETIESFKGESLEIPQIKVLKDSLVLDKIETLDFETFFTKVVYPLITSGIKNKEQKREILQSLINSIKGCIKRNNPDIIRWKDSIKPKYYNAFLDWLKTEEAKKVCDCLLTDTVKHGFDSFEINYLLNCL